MKSLVKVLLTLPIIFVSCSDNPVSENLPENLAGTWVYRSYENDVYTMEKSLSLEHDNSGLIFLDNGKLIERKIVGWCGTPPVVYDNYQGSWESLSAKELKVSVDFWGGTENFNLEIVSVTNSVLKFKKVMLQ